MQAGHTSCVIEVIPSRDWNRDYSQDFPFHFYYVLFNIREYLTDVHTLHYGVCRILLVSLMSLS